MAKSFERCDVTWLWRVITDESCRRRISPGSWSSDSESPEIVFKIWSWFVTCLLKPISPTLYEQLLHAQIPKVQKTLMIRLSFCAFEIFVYKSCCKTLMNKLTPAVNYTNVLCAAFVCADPKSAKRHWWLELFGSTWVTACKILVKLTP